MARECIIDVGSASIGACILEKKKAEPIIASSVRVPISSGAEEAKQAIATLALQAVGKSLEGLAKGPAPASVRFVLAAPWYDAKIRTIASKSEKPVRVNVQTVERSVRQYLAEKKEAMPQGRVLLESIVSQAYVNGYPTDLKKTVTGTTLRMNHYESVADQSFLLGLTEAAKKAFPHSKISFHSFAFVAFAVIRSLRDEDNFVIADVGGEITDIGVAHHDGFRFLGTFPVGTNSIVRTLAEGGSMADSASRLALFAKNDLSSDEAAAFGQKFQAASADWKKGYQSALETAINEVGIPQTTFLFADKDELKWLALMIEGVHGAFSSRAVTMSTELYQPLVELGEEATYDSFLCLEALYFRADRHDIRVS